MTGKLDMNGKQIKKLKDPSETTDAVNKQYVDDQDSAQVSKSGDTMTGALAMGTNRITGLGDPTSNQDAATKKYVDGRITHVTH